MFVREKFADIYLWGMRDRSMRSGTELARDIQLTDWSTAGNLSNRSSGVQISHDICTRFGRYLYSTKCSWIINYIISLTVHYVTLLTYNTLYFLLTRNTPTRYDNDCATAIITLSKRTRTHAHSKAAQV